MKTILCYGDSNTYGHIPESGKRYDRHERWTGILQGLLKEDYLVIEEGLCGRYIDYTDPKEPYKNGMSSLLSCLATHKPVDILFFMLGTNDCNTACAYTAEDIAHNMEKMLETAEDFLKAKQKTLPTIILASPIQIRENIADSPFSHEVGMDGVIKSRKLSPLYRQIAERRSCLFFDAGGMFKASLSDSEHLGKEEHRRFAEELYQLIRSIETDI